MFRRRPRPEQPARRAEPGTALVPGRTRTAERAVALPSAALVMELLDELGLRHSLDSDGDLLVRWETCAIYFFFYGEHDEVLQARLYLARRFDVEDRAALTVLLDEWNRTRLFGKAYTVLPDDGMVSVCAEQSHDFEGATRAQLKYAVVSWLDVLLRFGDWIDEQI